MFFLNSTQLQFEVNNQENEEQVNGLLSSCFSEEDNQSKRHFLQGLKNPNKIYSIDAKLGHSLIGSAVAWNTEFHPFCTYFSIIVNPLYKGEIGCALLKHIEDYLAIKFPIQTSVWETSFSLKSLYENNGFREVRRTNISKLNLSLVPNRNAIINKFQLAPLQNLVVSLSEISSNHKLKVKVITLVKETYKQTHKVNPLGVHEIEKWEQIIFGKNTILEGSYIIVNNNDVLGFALLHGSDDPNHLEFGRRGKKANSEDNIILLLTTYQIHFAKCRGYTSIKGEFDNTDPYSMELLNYFPFSPSPTLITLQKVRPYSQRRLWLL